jgi:hypothetical protein
MQIGFCGPLLGRDNFRSAGHLHLGDGSRRRMIAFEIFMTEHRIGDWASVGHPGQERRSGKVDLGLERGFGVARVEVEAF